MRDVEKFEIMRTCVWRHFIFLYICHLCDCVHTIFFVLCAISYFFQFLLFCRDLRGENLCLWRKNYKYQVWAEWTSGWWGLGAHLKKKIDTDHCSISNICISLHTTEAENQKISGMHPSELSKLKATDANCHL